MEFEIKKRCNSDMDSSFPSKKHKVHANCIDDCTRARTVMITNLTSNMSSEYLRGYFEHATGRPVDKVTLLQDWINNQFHVFAKITFLSPEDAEDCKRQLIAEQSRFIILEN